MHIVDGALSTEVLIGGAAITTVGLGYGLKKLTLENIPTAGVLSASFFIASLIAVPLGPSSVHLILSGLAGLVLGWAAFPALFVGLLLQAVFFGFGGLTVLGVNAVNIALPAVIVYYLCGRGVLSSSRMTAAIFGAIGGSLAIVLTAIFVAISLALTGDEFYQAVKLVLFAHIPVAVIEGLLSGAAIYLIYRVKPDLLRVASQTA